MNRNQKIALGCGGAGCLGLIFIAIVCGLFWFYLRSANMNVNRSANTNTSRGTNRSASSNANTNAGSSNAGSSISDDDKHKLFQAAEMTSDTDLVQRVLRKLGFVDERGISTAGYEQFVKDHFAWALKNMEFIKSVSTPEKARAYVEQHIND